jgi:hypothetical protein
MVDLAAQLPIPVAYFSCHKIEEHLRKEPGTEGALNEPAQVLKQLPGLAFDRPPLSDSQGQPKILKEQHKGNTNRVFILPYGREV